MAITVVRKAPSTKKPAVRAKPAVKAFKAPAKVVVVRAAPNVGYGEVFRATHGERFELLSRGISAKVLFSTIDDLGITQERALSTLRFPRSTILKAKKKNAADVILGRDESTILLGLRRLIGQVQTMVEESGEPEGFKAAKWLADWLYAPNPALNNRLPADYMHQTEGQELVSQLLAQMQSGAYA